jgi:uncharacterized repeat protein (TIGR02543 family)
MAKNLYFYRKTSRFLSALIALSLLFGGFSQLVFSPQAALADDSYYLTVNQETGGVVTAPGIGTLGPYTGGENVTLSVTPDPGHTFAGWTGDISTVSDPLALSSTITMSDNFSISATFSAIEYTLITNTVGSYYHR